MIFLKVAKIARIAIGNDHAAISLKHDIIEYLENRGAIADLGAQDRQGLDYPDYALSVCKSVIDGESELGILLCGTGAGMCIAANKIRGIRAVVCSDPCTARFARVHNDANILCIGARIVGTELAKTIVDAFLSASFEGGRHEERVAKIMKIESMST